VAVKYSQYAETNGSGAFSSMRSRFSTGWSAAIRALVVNMTEHEPLTGVRSAEFYNNLFMKYLMAFHWLAVRPVWLQLRPAASGFSQFLCK